MAAESASSSLKFSKLPEIAKPRHYDITLWPDLVNFTFKGIEKIDLQILKPTNYLMFHSNAIDFKEASLKTADGSEYTKLTVEFDAHWTTVTVHLPVELQSGDVTLHIEYSAILNDKMHGFYRSTYKTAEGEERFLACTQLASTYARMAFPCWDEPTYKATYDITLCVDEKLTALSNMNVLSETHENGLKVVKFATTPVMSTYIVAWVVGEFEYVETKTKMGVEIRVHSLPGKKEQGQFALDISKRAVEWYDQWFDIAYPLPKCDLVAIPDFCFNAMENWGLITYREIALLVDTATSSTKQKSRVALTVSHELAHMWFGNLVTMKWWTDLWLNEGFASFMEYLFVGTVCPELNTWLSFVNDELASALNLDALKNSHPIEVEINNPNEVDELYDRITYQKGNSINRMLCSYLSEETFRTGLRIYLKKFQYGNAITADLWSALGTASGQDINALMSPWTKQMGFPVVSVSQRQDGTKRVLKLTQGRFIADGSEDADKLLWQVPVGISTTTHPVDSKFKVLLKERQTEIVLDGVAPDEWVKLNAGTTGYYRVEYSEEMFKSLLPAFKSKTLPIVDRFGLANDLFALVLAGRVPAVQFLSLLSVCSEEDAYTVWTSLDEGVGALANILSRAGDDKLIQRFNAFVRNAYSPLAVKLGWEPAKNEDSQTSMLRALIQARMGKTGDGTTIDAARRKFDDHVKNHTELSPDLRLTIFSIVGHNGGMEGYEQLIKIYEATTFGEVQRHCLFALGQSSDDKIHRAAFEYGFEQSKVRAQDLPFLFAGAVATRQGQDFVWTYFKDHIHAVLDKFGGANSNLFPQVLKASCSSRVTDDDAKDMEAFFQSEAAKDCAKTLGRTVRQMIETVKMNSQLLKRSADPISQWLKTNGF
uniref:Aminopeptidase n=1 Tax=Plectus sambesii TaxID=2011161 RepID=A0A914XGU4_9BILA